MPTKKWLVASFILMFSALFQTAQANIIWDWSFAGESGTFVTDGTEALPDTYELIDFSVTSSGVGGTIGSLLGGQYTDGALFTNMPYEFVYDGSNIVQWLHSGTNTFDWWVFSSPLSDIDYLFAWDSGVNDPNKAAWWIDPTPGNYGVADLIVTPQDREIGQVSEPSIIALFTLGLIGVATTRTKRVISKI